MNEKAHRLTTRLALEVVASLQPGSWSPAAEAAIVEEAAQTDYYQDLEFVNVRAQRDDPHASGPRPDQDQAHTVTDFKSHTAFNHFLDIRKGPGRFDDYDGYSYRCGSAQQNEVQLARDVSGGWGRWIAELAGFKVDEGIAYWLNDEYVHVPGEKWYRRCSPAAERYSCFRDLHVYDSSRAETLARFPLAQDAGETGTGIPYSVFFPVDNLARYWYAEFLKHPKQVKYLGPVMHALQDASIPHHAAGCMGNWHVEYENALDAFAEKHFPQPEFLEQVRTRVQQWRLRPVGRLPARLTPRDGRRVPSLKWKVQDLVTWLALQAHQAYVHAYGEFKNGFKADVVSQNRLLTLAVAASALVLIKARQSSSPGGRKLLRGETGLV
ncbi:MAG: hypothetical protein HGA76_10925 [Candidatus Firestonebacteria bacterium]|nr:hypothetical protein [Candidatus Firestonebacteria bacterium]